LAKLWAVRTQTRWEGPTIIALGERLCEAHFAAGNRTDAIDLAEDIRYNLHDLYGCLDPGTIKMTSLLASFYVANGQPAYAIPLHRDVLLHIPEKDNWNQQPWMTDLAMARIGFEQARLLKLAYQRSGERSASEEEAAISDAINSCRSISGEDLQPSWIELGSIGEWQHVPEVSRKKGDGYWEPPFKWTLSCELATPQVIE
jgi:hypothetical protein